MDRVAGQLLDRREILGIRRTDEGDRGAAAAGASRPADAVDIVLGMGRNVEVVDVAHLGDVEAAGGDVAGDQQRERALAEGIERRHAGALFHVAMQGADVETVLFEAPVQRRDIALAVAEHDRVLQVLGVADQVAQEIALLEGLAADADHVLRHGLGGGRRTRGLDLDRVVQEGVGEALDFRRHRRGEEQRLVRTGAELADALDVRDEAHVEHAVGLVDDEDLDTVEQQLAALEVVEKTAGGGDQHIRAAIELLFLLVEGDAADQQRHGDAMVHAVADEVLLDLRGEFARRLEDQRPRHAGTRAALFDQGEHRQREGSRLAGARLCHADDVAALQDMRDRGGLNGRRLRIAGGLDSRQYLVAKSEFGKIHLIFRVVAGD
ncbi:hypothetical protein A6302_00928 [Methylobrevis pamukkalensis]|uniref:NAD-specific glutamate dehydrogenase n=1 Tax=Methylobrevis pamukkalensis TaxID=1439726 RepID=A0A1E3H6L5_9HYPH|nr:hypothetical protein A6302_00928 [Methylobrevis pamukkalensis]